MAQLINNLKSPWNIIAWIGMAVFVIVLAWALTRLNKIIFKHLRKNNIGTGLYLLFFQHLISVIMVVGFIILVFSSLSGVTSVWQTMLGGTAIISAVIAFAAQDVIKDVLAGMMISLHRPFQIGDRIVLEDGLAGIVEEMTMRHVILRGIDTTRYVVPNSKINSMRITNMTYGRGNRSAEFRFSIGYDSDMTLAKSVIKQAIESSKYSIPSLKDEDGNDKYTDVYFERFADSALILKVTVYYENSTPSERLIDDINVRVREALIANNIEIPYNYVNVVTQNQSSEENKK